MRPERAPGARAPGVRLVRSRSWTTAPLGSVSFAGSFASGAARFTGALLVCLGRDAERLPCIGDYGTARVAVRRSLWLYSAEVPKAVEIRGVRRGLHRAMPRNKRDRRAAREAVTHDWPIELRSVFAAAGDPDGGSITPPSTRGKHHDAEE